VVGLEWTVGAGKRKRAIWVPGRAIGFLGHSGWSSMIVASVGIRLVLILNRPSGQSLQSGRRVMNRLAEETAGFPYILRYCNAKERVSFTAMERY
jgi:hypothetical protein